VLLLCWLAWIIWLNGLERVHPHGFNVVCKVCFCGDWLSVVLYAFVMCWTGLCWYQLDESCECRWCFLCAIGMSLVLLCGGWVVAHGLFGSLCELDECCVALSRSLVSVVVSVWSFLLFWPSSAVSFISWLFLGRFEMQGVPDAIKKFLSDLGRNFKLDYALQGLYEDEFPNLSDKYVLRLAWVVSVTLDVMIACRLFQLL